MDAVKAAPAMKLIDAKHALAEAQATSLYATFKAKADADAQLAKDAEARVKGATTAKTNAGKAIVAALKGTPPADASKDDTTARIARIVADLQIKHDAAVKTQGTKQTEATEAGTKLTAAQTAATSADTRFTAAKTAYNEAAGAIEDGEARSDLDATEEAALVAAEVEYAGAYVANSGAQKALTAATTATVNAQTALTMATTEVTTALEAVNNPAAHGYIFDPANPAAALTDELLKAAGDDSGAIVKAVDETYQATEDNADRLDELLTPESTMAVLDEDGEPMMDADGNPVTTTVPESGRIVDLETKVDGQLGGVGENTADIEKLDGRVADNETAIADHDMKLMAKKRYIDAIGVEMGFDPATGMGTGAGGNSRIDTNEASIGALGGRVTVNEGAISGNTAMIGELSESLEVVRAGVAASMARRNAGDQRSRNVGSFDGESAFAVGFQIHNATSFKVGVTSSGGATGASAGVGFQF